MTDVSVMKMDSARSTTPRMAEWRNRCGTLAEPLVDFLDVRDVDGRSDHAAGGPGAS